MMQAFVKVEEGRFFPCTFEGCTCVYTQPSHLQRHVQSKHNNVRHFCPHCDCSYAYKDRLSRHIKQKHPDKFIDNAPSWKRTSMPKPRVTHDKSQDSSSSDSYEPPYPTRHNKPSPTSDSSQEPRNRLEYDHSDDSEEEIHDLHTPYDDVTCEVCKSGKNEEKLIICDRCAKNGKHLECFMPSMKTLPRGDWFCMECIEWFNDFCAKYG